ncbi:HD domain-containing protein [Yinghuangia seranimata]|uniref:HD domain-containing protein n=1 Tax=Yinghuangia seranimata TaxID=408067 RepID=UPI00248AB481|nr:HD domain-containing protein [Yinghuangia seranimata]MDI2128758.1 HDIG domain-containing protein [Yinghuangia seranimata]
MGTDLDVITDAAELAGQLLPPLGDRWAHVQAVAKKAEAIADAVPEGDRDLLVASAWLHDIGYAHDVRTTGFHPLDGSRFAESLGASRRLCCLIAHHSGAVFEAEQRGLSVELSAFEREDGPVLDALIYADMTTGPQGQSLDFEDRIDEILVRYQPGDPVHQAITNARPYLRAAVHRTEERLTDVRGRATF